MDHWGGVWQSPTDLNARLESIDEDWADEAKFDEENNEIEKRNKKTLDIIFTSTDSSS